MVEFKMLVGVPGSGKSTYANECGCYVASSDAIRQELFGDATIQDQHDKVFSTLRKRVVRTLCNKQSVIYDATNLNSNRRIGELANIASVSHDILKTCVIFATPIDVCVERDSKRERTVGRHVIEKMLKNFECPDYYEGWDKIEIIRAGSDYQIPDLTDFEQDTKHHKFSLEEHMTKTAELVKNYSNDKVLEFAARWHDIGKYYTKSFINTKGEVTEDAHYYGHNGYGAYLMLTHFDAFAEASDLTTELRTDEVALRASALIAHHMKPYLSWEVSERTKTRDMERMGALFQDIMKLHMADALAH